jgi:hypothetical protein
MTAFPAAEQPRPVSDIAPVPADVAAFARVERLTGEEHALLMIPAKERTREQHERLDSISAELDRVWQKLRERAERLARHVREGPRTT